MLSAFDTSSLTGVFLVLLVEKNLPANAGDSRDMGLIPGSRRSPGGGHGNPLPFLAWRIPWRGAWKATVHGVSQNQTWLKRLSTWKRKYRLDSPKDPGRWHLLKALWASITFWEQKGTTRRLNLTTSATEKQRSQKLNYQWCDNLSLQLNNISFML